MPVHLGVLIQQTKPVFVAKTTFMGKTVWRKEEGGVKKSDNKRGGERERLCWERVGGERGRE